MENQSILDHLGKIEKQVAPMKWLWGGVLALVFAGFAAGAAITDLGRTVNATAEAAEVAAKTVDANSLKITALETERRVNDLRWKTVDKALDDLKVGMNEIMKELRKK